MAVHLRRARDTRRVGPTQTTSSHKRKENPVGSVYSRKATTFLSIKYLQHGRVIRASTQTDNIVKARRMLRDREGDVEKGVPISPDVGRITFDDASADLLNDYSSTGRKRTMTHGAGSENICRRSSGIVG
jgi:hypothetical protein